MNDGLWAPSTASSTASILDGNAMEELMCRSLEDNVYSVQGFWLWQARSVQQRRQREQSRRRPRSEVDLLQREALTASEAGSPRNQAEATAKQHAEEVRSYVSALLHATGYPFPVPSDAAKKVTEGKKDAILEDTAAKDGLPEGSAPAVRYLSAPLPAKSEASELEVDAPPLKVAHVERLATAAALSASPPKSALARLVAKAKAQHCGVAEGNPDVVVVPAPKYPSLPEEILGVRLAQGTSSLPPSAAQKKKVQFAIAVHDSAASGHRSRSEAERESDDEEDFVVQLPGHVASSSSTSSPQDGKEGASTVDATLAEDAVAAKHPSQMTRTEFLSQFKRAPRRGEIGQTAEDIAAAEKLGYVMSGSRSVASRMYVDRIQRQLHEHEAAKLQQQFRKVEDERMDDQLVHGLADFVMKKNLS
ncbi:hypothetical protein ABL78_3093 [Leptomonas seymouri]|uniref:NF-kappa-B-activating protein C-terminal domain-containing protein n=1 Tax=Leptomonas seymouri TaxID=5684 RepID=A0A0N1HYC1_LEPSE|nr:hypothetical protein ABL78_3093 [Leptomonas seymouri]|eukprot:KPI87794.1 hypothetical protein ABL78_3093 [Leptomonas seymouri]